jgi:tryptophanyl-tRNA synthetase
VRAFNARYGEIFVEPQAVFTDSPIVRGTDGGAKMSKSQGNTIDIFADEAAIRKQIMGMVTDTKRILRTDPGRPEVCNVCQLHRFFSPTDYETIWDGERTARTGCVDTKRLLAERVLDFFAEARERRLELEARPGYVEDVLRAGAERLAPLAAETMRICRDATGLGSRP